jgi:hypothetical protein
LGLFIRLKTPHIIGNLNAKKHGQNHRNPMWSLMTRHRDEYLEGIDYMKPKHQSPETAKAQE